MTAWPALDYEALGDQAPDRVTASPADLAAEVDMSPGTARTVINELLKRRHPDGPDCR
jgi:hypothetical protein